MNSVSVLLLLVVISTCSLSALASSSPAKTRYINFLDNNNSSDSPSNVHVANALYLGQEGLPIATHSLQDFPFFNLSQIRLERQTKTQSSLLYTLPVLTTTGVQQLEDLLQRDVWIEFSIQPPPASKYVETLFRIPIGVHGHLFTHYTFNCLYQPDQERISHVQIVGNHLKEPDVLLNGAVEVAFDIDWTSANGTLETFLWQKARSCKLWAYNSLGMLVALAGLILALGLKAVGRTVGPLSAVETAPPEFNSTIFGLDLQTALGTVGEESLSDVGWKAVCADVFREPFAVALFGIAIGVGIQTASAIVIAYIFAEKVRDLGFIFAYCIASPIGGTVCGFCLRSFGSADSLVNSTLLFSTIVQMMLFLGGSLVEALALSAMNSSLNSGWSMHLLKVLLALALCNGPLFAAGSFLSNYLTVTFPGRSSSLMKERKTVPLSRVQWLEFCLPCALLPAFALVKETMDFDFTFTSLSPHFILTFAAAAGLAGCCSVVSTFALLNTQRHRWQWHSFCCGGIPAVLLFCFVVSRAFIQISCFSPVEFAYFMGQAAVYCSLLAFALGSVGFLSTLGFLVLLYRNLKFD